MASPSPKTGAPGASAAPAQPASKAKAATPQVNSEMEMGNMTGADGASQETKQDDIMQLARLGDLGAMEKLFETEGLDATYSDGEGITPLHWAAINNQYAMCKFLIEHGAEINHKGGESVATPLQWAAQRCHYYVVHLLLQHGADPLITDAQGYNTLHISTFNGNVLLLVLLLHQGIPVDVIDSFGHTALMWAAYKGYPQAVDVFLRWGANVQAVDEQGFTALHWALVKGHPVCVMKLIEYGADRFAKTDSGKTPAVTASELNTEAAWFKALRECGYDDEGHALTPPWPGASYFLQDKKGFINKFTFFSPFVLVWACVSIVAYMPVYVGLPMALVVSYALLWVVKQVLAYAPAGMSLFQRTPWMAGIFAGSLFLVGLNWFTTILPSTTFRANADNAHLFLNLLFAVYFALTAFFYGASMRYDPGYVPKMNGIAEQKAVIDELLQLWKYDEYNFCVICMIRTPLRSKHCKACGRCVAKHDHHCPWVNNCVGVNNHRHFFLYLIFLTLGIACYDLLLYKYFAFASKNASDSCNILSPALCSVLNADSYTLILAFWASLQLLWVTMLIFTQFVQISRAMTTFENMYGVHSVSTTTAFTSTGTPLDPNHPSLSAASATEPHAHRHPKGGMFKQIGRLLGVDPFIETIAGRGAATGKMNKKKKNPFSRGCIGNCKDFWCDATPIFGQKENGLARLGGDSVNYTMMYESPALMTIARGRRARNGYEIVGTEEV